MAFSAGFNQIARTSYSSFSCRAFLEIFREDAASQKKAYRRILSTDPKNFSSLDVTHESTIPSNSAGLNKMIKNQSVKTVTTR